MNRVIAVVLAASLVGSSTPAFPATPYRHADEAIVRVECGGVGTAFHIGKGLYVTAAHVVAGCKDQPGIVIYDEAKDVAVIRGAVIKARIKYSCSRFNPGEEYLAIGFAHGFPFKTFIPVIASKFIQKGYQSFIGEMIPGMSGGPILDEYGRAHGIVNMRWPGRSQELADTVVCKGGL